MEDTFLNRPTIKFMVPDLQPRSRSIWHPPFHSATREIPRSSSMVKTSKASTCFESFTQMRSLNCGLRVSVGQ